MARNAILARPIGNRKYEKFIINKIKFLHNGKKIDIKSKILNPYCTVKYENVNE